MLLCRGIISIIKLLIIKRHDTCFRFPYVNPQSTSVHLIPRYQYSP